MHHSILLYIKKVFSEKICKFYKFARAQTIAMNKKCYGKEHEGTKRDETKIAGAAAIINEVLQESDLTSSMQWKLRKCIFVFRRIIFLPDRCIFEQFDLSNELVTQVYLIDAYFMKEPIDQLLRCSSCYKFINYSIYCKIAVLVTLLLTRSKKILKYSIYSYKFYCH